VGAWKKVGGGGLGLVGDGRCGCGWSGCPSRGGREVKEN
jgi:hypothetical protein